MTAKSEKLSTQQLTVARQRGEQLGEFLLTFDYFLRETPEGRAVVAEIEQDWQRTCESLRADKKLIGSHFSLASWWKQIRKELLNSAQAKPTKERLKERPKAKVIRTSKKTLRFRGI
ncbi:hypothetical protein IJJ27_03080 [bacterium]|nr:hypothetical protein [bacterium]MBQ6436517.1 hypothetical protein [bacterium]